MADHHDAVLRLLSAMEAAGVKPGEPIAHQLLSGELVRFHVEGDRAGRRNGWARMHLDGRPAGAFGCMKRQISEKWSAGMPAREFTREERVAYAKRMQSQREQRAVEKAAAEIAAAKRAANLIRRSDPAHDHPYLQKKNVRGDGLRQLGDIVLAPMQTESGELWNVQCIAADGEKRFLKGGRQSGLMWSIDGHGATILLTEGVGTAAALHRATSATCYAGFSASGLLKVAPLIRLIWPDRPIVVCADDDSHLVGHPQILRNVGIEDAKSAAAAIGGRVAVPPRSAHVSPEAAWDFADVENDDEIRAAVRGAMAPSLPAQRIGAFGSLEARLSSDRPW